MLDEVGEAIAPSSLECPVVFVRERARSVLGFLGLDVANRAQRAKIPDLDGECSSLSLGLEIRRPFLRSRADKAPGGDDRRPLGRKL